MRTAEDEVLLALARTVVGGATSAADQLARLSVVRLRALTVLRGLGAGNLGQPAVGMGFTVSMATRPVAVLVEVAGTAAPVAAS